MSGGSKLYTQVPPDKARCPGHRDNHR
jgi:hypothetical protein